MAEDRDSEMGTKTRGNGNAGNGRVLSAARSVEERTFDRVDLPQLRRLAAGFGARAGMCATCTDDFVLAVSEAAASAISHGPHPACLRLWAVGKRVFCEIRGGAMVREHGLTAIRQGDVETLRLWVLEQVCDDVAVATGPDGVTVRFSMAVR
jgi:serine/threonine-protein kinase RsbW